MDTHSALLAIKPLHCQGHELLKERWLPLVQELRSALQTLGFENPDSCDSLLLFTFDNACSAITATLTHTNKIHRDLANELGEHTLPIQIILHLPVGNESNSPYRNPDAKLWEMVEEDIVHVTKQVKAAWDMLIASATLPPCSLTKAGDGLFALQISAKTFIAAESILACRQLPVQGQGQPCFYCGMLSHAPAHCPSKLLPLELNGLSTIGYLTFAQLAAAFNRVFSNVPAMTKHLAGGISSEELKKSSDLVVFVAFFDIYRIYQPRFLSTIAFSRFSKWQSLFKAEMLQPDSKNLQLGFDCLRVGKYGQAEEFLMREAHAKSPKRFPATMGMAFVCLEQRGLAAMRNHLEQAKTLATQPKEQIYADLVLSRFYELIGEVWKARDIIRSLTSSQLDCPEGLYRKLQLEAKDNFSAEACQLLRVLMIDQRNLFMAALMDPALIPIQSKVEDLLSSQYEIMSSSALDSVSQAENELEELALWCDSSDTQVQASHASLSTLKKHLHHKSYFGVLDVEYQAKLLLAALRQNKEEKLNRLFEQINKSKTLAREYHRYWMGYRYQSFFKNFIQGLETLEKPLHEGGELIKKNDGASFRQAMEIIKSTESTLSTLAADQQRMTLTSSVCDSVISFIKKLAVTEIVGFVLAATVVFLLGQLPAENMLDGLAALASDPMFQKKAMTLTAFVIAPLLALSWTIKKHLEV